VRGLRVPAAAAIAVLAICVWMHVRILALTDGAVSYPVDDAFIHLAIAETLAFSGTYGVTPGEFTSASSSIAWPFIVAGCMRVFGDSAWLPLYLNVGVGAGVPFALDRLMRETVPELSEPRRAAAMAVALLLGPLPTLITLGMEHTLHALLIVLLLTELLRKNHLRVCVLAFACTLVRYESLLLIALSALWLAQNKHYRHALVLLSVGAAPALFFGLFLKAHDHPFLPLSVKLKGLHIASFADVVSALLPWAKLRSNWPTALVGVAAMLAALFARHTRGDKVRNALGLLLATLAAQCVLGQLGWFYRYDAYLVLPLVGCSSVAILPGSAPEAGSPPPTFTVLRAAVAALILCALPRGLYALGTTAEAAGNIYNQQVHSARFLAVHFPTGSVLVNDIGAVAYYRRAPLVDLMGLANKDIAKARGWRIDQPLSAADIEKAAEGSDVAVIYDEWFQGAIPSTWHRVARWTISNNRVCAFASVSVYATRVESLGGVQDAAAAFAPRNSRE
jgi:hypothetical protein